MNTALQKTVLHKTFSSLGNHNYRLFFFSQLVSFSGTWMQLLGLSWLVLELTGRGSALGAVMAAQFLPTLLLAPLGGVVADRFDKRLLLIWTQSVAAALAVVLGVLTVTGVIEVWMIYTLALGFGLVTAVDNPSRHTFVLEMVGPSEITNAVTLNSVVVNAARAIGPAIGGLVISSVGIGMCFLLNGASFLVVVGALLALRTADLVPSKRAVRRPGQLREGFRYAWQDRTLRTTLIILALVGTFTQEFPTTLPLVSEFTFSAGPGGLATMTTLMGLGAVVGGLATTGIGKATASALAWSALLLGCLVCVAALMPTLTWFYLLMPPVGALSVAVIALSNARLQLHAIPEFRGRVMALFSVALLGSTPIGGPIVGWASDAVDPRFSLLIGGVASLAAGTYGWITCRSDKRSGQESTGVGDLPELGRLGEAEDDFGTGHPGGHAPQPECTARGVGVAAEHVLVQQLDEPGIGHAAVGGGELRSVDEVGGDRSNGLR